MAMSASYRRACVPEEWRVYTSTRTSTCCSACRARVNSCAPLGAQLSTLRRIPSFKTAIKFVIVCNPSSKSSFPSNLSGKSHVTLDKPDSTTETRSACCRTHVLYASNNSMELQAQPLVVVQGRLRDLVQRRWV